MTSVTREPDTFGNPPAEPNSYTTFRLRDDWFGIATDLVKEITVVPPLTPIPHAPGAVRGYVNLRGHIVLVVDLNCLLQRSPAELGDDSRLIVFKPQMGDAWGVLVERIGDMVELTTRQIESHRAGGDGDRQNAGLLPQEELVHGVGKLDGHLLLILDACRLPACLEHAIERRGQALFSHRNPSKERSL